MYSKKHGISHEKAPHRAAHFSGLAPDYITGFEDMEPEEELPFHMNPA